MDERVLRNIQKLRSAGADDGTIDAYLREEGLTRSEVLREMSKRKTKAETGIDTESSFLGSLAQGATLGFSDEIMAGVRSLGGADYDKALQAEQDALTRYRQANPGRAIAGELAGGLATAWVPGMGQANVARSLGQTAVRAAGQGAALGGIAGFGSANGGLENRLEGAAAGAALGGGIGGAVPVAMFAGRAGKELAQDMLPLRTAAGQTRRADELLAQALERDGKSPDEIRRLLAEAERAGKPLGILDIAGQNTLGLGRAAASVPSSSKQAAYESLMQRADDAPARISSDLQDAMGTPQTSYLDVFNTLQQKLRTSSKPLYDKAYQAADYVDDPDILRFLRPDGPLRKVLPQAWKEAQDQAALEGDTLVNPFRLVKNADGEEFLSLSGGISLKSLDYIKRGLDDVIGATQGNKRRLIRNVKNEFVSALDNKYPEYRAARAQYKGDAEMNEALESGRAFLSEHSDVTAAQIAKMSQAEKQVFRIGAITSIRDAINTAADRSDIVRRIFNSTEKRAQLRAVFPSDAAYRKFEQMMKLESQAAQSKNAILSGSRTTPLAQEVQDMGMSPSLMADLVRNPVGAVARVGAGELLKNRMQGVRGAVADSLNSRLYDFNPARQRGVLDAMEQTQRQMGVEQLRRQQMRQNLGRSLGTVPGLFAE